LQRLYRHLRLICINLKPHSMKSSSFLKSITLIFVITLSYMQVNAQRNVAVKSFNSIGVSSGIDLYLTQGTSETLTIKGDNDLIKDVVVEQNGTSLTIKYKDGINWSKLFSNQSIKVYVNFKSLKSLSASGGSDVYSVNTIKTDLLSISASGGADIDLSLTCNDLSVSTSGGADIKLKGSGENISVSASGGADVHAFGYVVNNAKASASGGADVDIYVNKALEANASGGGDVSYKGNPSVKKNNSRSGDVTHVN
jgi:hypothetical protein